MSNYQLTLIIDIPVLEGRGLYAIFFGQWSVLSCKRIFLYPLPITYYLLPITYYLLPITYYLLPITHYPVPCSLLPI
ncbi:hypothetical protein [Dolichospermum circinale]|uniref:hypothetical protein n=1 Tax=Dolichospermum circinale TaxID=109265 RepID=UPI00232C2E2D|nr:hypothetical protein [Dolichospermum circinale]MDB9462576.1 hypothetical protein [Dolichospermum circinale CS-541/04]MDB9546373.1 hypothetical protein [Dolichospermum circinale CS-1031]